MFNLTHKKLKRSPLVFIRNGHCFVKKILSVPQLAVFTASIVTPYSSILMAANVILSGMAISGVLTARANNQILFNLKNDTKKNLGTLLGQPEKIEGLDSPVGRAVLASEMNRMRFLRLGSPDSTSGRMVFSIQDNHNKQEHFNQKAAIIYLGVVLTHLTQKEVILNLDEGSFFVASLRVENEFLTPGAILDLIQKCEFMLQAVFDIEAVLPYVANGDINIPVCLTSSDELARAANIYPKDEAHTLLNFEPTEIDGIPATVSRSAMNGGGSVEILCVSNEVRVTPINETGQSGTTLTYKTLPDAMKVWGGVILHEPCTDTSNTSPSMG